MILMLQSQKDHESENDSKGPCHGLAVLGEPKTDVGETQCHEGVKQDFHKFDCNDTQHCTRNWMRSIL